MAIRILGSGNSCGILFLSLLMLAIFFTGISAQTTVPEPIPPVYAKLKDLHLRTVLVEGGKVMAVIVTSADRTYDAQAVRIREAIRERSGVTVPIVLDGDDIAAVPIGGNLILLGNRSTNRAIGALYNRYYTLLDLRYPGIGGYVVRSLHNPFGNGRNVLFVGGSDTVGVARATDVFVEKLAQAEGGDGTLSVGRLMEIQLGKGITLPQDVREFEIWEASAGYKSVGYFGWTSISKRMAMYYMTGDAFHAREFLRLSFPDAQAKAEIAEIDGERIENKDDPLGGPYHYNAHMMILYWDLIEESPVFSDAERLRVTNAFSRQLNHRKGERVYNRTKPPSRVGSRHGQWSAISLYCLGRYFQRGYPDPIWQHCMDAGRMHFEPLHRHAWVAGESDNLFWYNTGTAPILTYMLLTGDRVPLENGVLATLLRGQEMLISGREPDWALRSASIGYLHKAAYLMQDGRYLEYARRTGVDLDVFRLGQSFWPEAHLKPEQPTDLVGRWSVLGLPEPMWEARKSGLPLSDSFQFGSFRSATDASGDFILIDGFNGASRNPYHTFAILELRLNGETVLQGYLNQMLTKADGMVEPVVAMNGALRYRDAIGGTAVAVGEVPNAAFCNWRRSLVQRIGRYALVADRLTFRTDSDYMEAQLKWEGRRRWEVNPEGGGVRTKGETATFEILSSDPLETAVSRRTVTMRWTGPVKAGGGRNFFSLIAPTEADSGRSLQCARLGEHAAALGLPEPAVAVQGEYKGVRGDLAVLAESHLFGVGVTRAGLDVPLLEAEAPVNVDWDFESGVLELIVDADTRVHLALASPSRVQLDGKSVELQKASGGMVAFHAASGRHTLTGVRPAQNVVKRTSGGLAALLARGAETRASGAEVAQPSDTPDAQVVPAIFATSVGGRVVDMVIASAGGSTRICAAEGNAVHVLTQEGKVLRTLQTDGPIRVLRWWQEHGLLLAGCVDEKVIAFDLEGNRRWTFVSEMHPAVFRAAKTYWFKSARGHEGIHGLHTGVFHNGESQAFVGSACTLEILNSDGKLVKRLPVFWGPGSKFALIDGEGGSVDLLIARQPTDGPTLRIVNSRTLKVEGRGFHGFPRGHTYIGGWANMSRRHIFYTDLDGDGEKEVAGEINGTWNRVGVWGRDGKPRYNANFGPGRRIPALNMRDLDVADLDGDGEQEIVTATSEGLVVALDHQCRKVWARRLPSPPTVLACVRADGKARIVVGCEDGSLIVLDGDGEVVGAGQVDGRPTCILVVGEAVIVATDGGEVRAFSAVPVESARE